MPEISERDWQAAIERVRAICDDVEYKDPGWPDTYGPYAEGRHDLAAEVLAAIDEAEVSESAAERLQREKDELWDGLNAWQQRAETAEAAIEEVRDLASDDADLRSGVVGMVRVSDIRRALARTEAPA